MSIATLRTAQEPPEASDTRPADTFNVSHEAARFAVLRRMGSAIRHQLAGALQPITMVASLLERRVQAGTPNLDALRRSAVEMTALSRSASSECVALMSWIAPHDGDLVALDEGVQDCLRLLATELSFRGFSVVDATQGQQGRVARQTLRTMLPASLMALTDRAVKPARIQVTAQSSATQVTLSLIMTPLDGDQVPSLPKAYRALTWQDVRALAEEEHVKARCTDTGIELVLKREDRGASDEEAVRWG